MMRHAMTALITRSRRAAVWWPVSSTSHFSDRCQSSIRHLRAYQSTIRIASSRNGDRRNHWFGAFGRFRLAHVNDLNGKRRGSARRQQDGTDLRVGDAFLASVGRLAFTDLGPLAQARDHKFPTALDRCGADAVEQLLRFRQFPAVPGAHQNNCRDAAARRTFRRSPLPVTLISCVPSSRRAASAHSRSPRSHRADLRSSGSLFLPGRGALKFQQT